MIPGFNAEAAIYESETNFHAICAQARGGEVGPVVPAIPPCHACDHILELCIRGEATGAVCRACWIGHCDPQDWKRPPRPFPRSEPWGLPF